VPGRLARRRRGRQQPRPAVRPGRAGGRPSRPGPVRFAAEAAPNRGHGRQTLIGTRFGRDVAAVRMAVAGRVSGSGRGRAAARARACCRAGMGMLPRGRGRAAARARACCRACVGMLLRVRGRAAERARCRAGAGVLPSGRAAARARACCRAGAGVLPRGRAAARKVHNRLRVWARTVVALSPVGEIDGAGEGLKDGLGVGGDDIHMDRAAVADPHRAAVSERRMLVDRRCGRRLPAQHRE
jgi:hypothetical protein